MNLRVAAAAVAIGFSIGLVALAAIVWFVPTLEVGRPEMACADRYVKYATELPTDVAPEQTPEADYNPLLQRLTCTWTDASGADYVRSEWIGSPERARFVAISVGASLVLFAPGALHLVRAWRQPRDRSDR